MIDSDTPLLLVHGWGAARTSWDAHAELWPRDRRVLTPDLPGHGDLARIGSGPNTITAALAHLVEIIHRAGSTPVIAVGHSMGGQLTARLHVEHPELVAAEIVIDPAYGSGEAPSRVAAWERRIRDSGHAALDDFVAGAFSHRTSPHLRRQILDGVHSTSPDVLADYLHSEYLSSDSVGPHGPAIALLKKRTRPVLALCSSRSAGEFETMVHPASTVDVWEGYGHYLHQEDPVRFVSSVTNWLASLE